MALPNDMTRTVGELSRLAASSSEYDGDQRLAARTLIRRTISFATTSVLANGSNAIVPNAAPSLRMIANGRVLGAYFITQLAVTAANANNANIAVKKLYANGLVSTTLATQSTNTALNGGTGNLVVGVPAELTVTDIANSRFSVGEVIGPAVDQNASGVVMGAGTLCVDIELEGAATDYPLSTG